MEILSDLCSVSAYDTLLGGKLSTYCLGRFSRVNPNFTDPTARQTIKKAYEFALNHVGQDKDSGEIWRDYIDFLKNAEARHVLSTKV